MFQELAGVSALVAAGMVGIVSFGNGAGRIFWAWVSDLMPRRFEAVGHPAAHRALSEDGDLAHAYAFPRSEALSSVSVAYDETGG